MKKRLFIVLFLGCVAAIITGCVNTLDGRMKAGVPFTKDTIEARYERPADQIFAAAKEVLGFNGVLRAENTINKTLEAKVNNSTVWVKVTPVENVANLSQLTVQARTKSGGGDIALASEMDKQIALRLK